MMQDDDDLPPVIRAPSGLNSPAPRPSQSDVYADHLIPGRNAVPGSEKPSAQLIKSQQAQPAELAVQERSTESSSLHFRSDDPLASDGQDESREESLSGTDPQTPSLDAESETDQVEPVPVQAGSKWRRKKVKTNKPAKTEAAGNPKSFLARNKVPLLVVALMVAGGVYKQLNTQNIEQAVMSMYKDPFDIGVEKLQHADKNVDPFAETVTEQSAIDEALGDAFISAQDETVAETNIAQEEDPDLQYLLNDDDAEVVEADQVVVDQAVEPQAEQLTSQPVAEVEPFAGLEEVDSAAATPAQAENSDQSEIVRDLTEKNASLEAQLVSLRADLQALKETSAPKPKVEAAPPVKQVAPQPIKTKAPAQPKPQVAARPTPKAPQASPSRKDIHFLGGFSQNGQVVAHALVGDNVIALTQGMKINGLVVESVAVDGVKINGNVYR